MLRAAREIEDKLVVRWTNGRFGKGSTKKSVEGASLNVGSKCATGQKCDSG